MIDPNLAMLELVVHALGPVCREVVFVGGCATGLLLTRERPERIRVTEDVDVVAHALTAQEYHAVEQRLRARGFRNDLRPGAPICRWVVRNVTVDVMPTEKGILGFSNRWYPLAIATAQDRMLPSGGSIRLISGPAFVATKLEAFKDRGRDASGQPDYLGSHDLEDIITVVDRRSELLDECRVAPDDLRRYLSQSFAVLLRTPDFVTSLAGHLPGDAFSQRRLGGLRDTLQALSNI
ncbi:MAG: hypothetical protein KIT53_15310 [Hydrogenophaga sp.]|nr:hypothetical protein [Hydrogenophaga sp.]